MLDVRAIAVQGVGSAPSVLAVQGFYLQSQVQPETPPQFGPRPSPRKRDDKRDVDDDILLFIL